MTVTRRCYSALPGIWQNTASLKARFTSFFSLPKKTRAAAALRTAARLGPKTTTDSEKRADLDLDLEKRAGAAERCAEFTEWLVRLALASAYPGAPYERKYMALDVLNAVAETWGVGRVSDDDGRFQKRPTDFDFDSRAERLERSPYRVCLGADVTTALLG